MDPVDLEGPDLVDRPRPPAPGVLDLVDLPRLPDPALRPASPHRKRRHPRVLRHPLLSRPRADRRPLVPPPARRLALPPRVPARPAPPVPVLVPGEA